MMKISIHPLNQPTPLPWSNAFASVRNCEQVHTSVLNLNFQQAKVAGVGNLSKWRPKSAIVVGLPHNSSKSLLNWRWLDFCADGPDWHSRILILFLPFTFLHCGWMEWLLAWWIPLIQFQRLRCRWWRIWICKKNVSRYVMCVQNAWRPFSTARRYERLSQHFFRYWMRWKWHWSW